MPATRGVVPFCLNDAPSFIERAFPAHKISVESQAERTAGAGQTLTALGSYWKGRKPLVLCRACIVGSLLPATDNPEKDLEVFELLMGIADESFEFRTAKSKPTRGKEYADIDAKKRGTLIATYGPHLRSQLVDDDGNWVVKNPTRARLLGKVFAGMPYSDRLSHAYRPEEVADDLYSTIWDRVNAHLGTKARSHAELVEQLGIMRFGHRPIIADTFAGGGSIPFEAARLGCDVVASDLNPVASLLTWGALHLVGADASTRARIAKAQQRVLSAVDGTISHLGIEHDSSGNRAKAFLYCLEVRCPQTDYMIPLATSWIISKNKRCVATLSAVPHEKRFRIDILSGASHDQLEAARLGTIQGDDIVYVIDGTAYRTSIASIRGDRRVNGQSVSAMRRWEKTDFVPRASDTFRERLYCIQWQDSKSDSIFFRAVTPEDAARESKVEDIVNKNLQQWQSDGLVPDMSIEPGYNTDQPTRERGWTYWHHLFGARHLLMLQTMHRAILDLPDATEQAALSILFTNALDRCSRLCQWRVGHSGREGVAPAGDYPEHVFYNQALNVFFNYAVRGFILASDSLSKLGHHAPVYSSGTVTCAAAAEVSARIDIGITDPPYADAVNYHEITEYFIAWLRKHPPAPLAEWIWDSRRALAIKGKGEDFRREMVKAYKALTDHMPDNGIQIVMFTHQDGKVWADMAGIFWGAGLKVTAAWYIATETSSELKKGGYVQGTVILVLRKRTTSEKTYKDELVLEIRQEVQRQIETMVGLNQSTRFHGRSENLFEDADLQMAGYAAALRVLTAYTHIDGTDMTRDAIRPREEGERSLTEEVIDLSISIANEYLVPEGLDPHVWEHLEGSERFYLRMLDVETSGLKKLDNYQNFAKAFKVSNYQPLMHSVKANDARLKSATEFGRAEFTGSEFGTSMLRAVLYGLMELQKEGDTDDVMSHLRDNIQDYMRRRHDIAHVASYIAAKLDKLRPEEASAARVLHGLVRNERVGA